jgi:flagellar basal body-associated protein FliL
MEATHEEETVDALGARPGWRGRHLQDCPCEAKEDAPKPKVEGSVYVLPKEFLVNIADGRYAMLSVGLILDIHDTSVAAGGGHGGGAAPPEGYGAMAQEAVVRDLITDALTSASDRQLIAREGRERLKKRILAKIRQKTDVSAEEVLFMDLTVQ